MNNIELIHDNCLNYMKNMEDESIDLTVTSPPYDNLRDFNGCSVFDFNNTAKQLFRITKNGGVVVWIVNDATINGDETGTSFKQALYFKKIGFNLHDTMIWQKANPIPRKDAFRYMPSFDYMFVFSKGKPKTVNLITELCVQKQNYNYQTSWGRNKDGKLKKSKGKGVTGSTKPKYNIWTTRVGGIKVDHPAVFPEKIARDHIVSWSNEGDIIFDPFLGSGTTGILCYELNRNFIGVEIAENYFYLAKKRIKSAQKQLKLFNKKEGTNYE